MHLAFHDGSHILNPHEIAAAYNRGMGNLDPQQQQYAGIAATAATTTGGILAALGVFGAAGGPIGAAIAGIAAIGVAIANVFSGCGQACIAATQIDNQLEPVLLQNLQHYMGSPVHYASLQRAALNNFDIAWAAYVKAEQGVPQQGAISIAERQAGGCHSAWNSPDGSCWNWFIGYRDPIANDPNVVPDPAPTGGGSSGGGSIFGGGSTGGSGASVTPLLMIAGAGILAMAVLD